MEVGSAFWWLPRRCAFALLWLHTKKISYPLHDSPDLLGDHSYFWGQVPPSPDLGQSVNLLTSTAKEPCSVPQQPGSRIQSHSALVGAADLTKSQDMHPIILSTPIAPSILSLEVYMVCISHSPLPLQLFSHFLTSSWLSEANPISPFITCRTSPLPQFQTFRCTADDLAKTLASLLPDSVLCQDHPPAKPLSFPGSKGEGGFLLPVSDAVHARV